MSGGDAPGMNAVLHSIWQTCMAKKIGLCCFHRGFQGILDRDIASLESPGNVLLTSASSILRTGRCMGFHKKDVRQDAVKILREMGIDGLIVCGGNGSLRGAKDLADEGFPTVGIPVTIDGDIFSSESSIGLATAVQAVSTELTALRHTADAYPGRIFLLEALGGKRGTLALLAGLAADADMIVIPEADTAVDKVVLKVQAVLNHRGSCIGVVCEGALPGWESGDQNSIEQYGLAILKATSIRVRYTMAGYGLRGLSPTAEDCLFAITCGTLAVQALADGKSSLIAGKKNGQYKLLPNDSNLNNSSDITWIALADKLGKLPK